MGRRLIAGRLVAAVALAAIAGACGGGSAPFVPSATGAADPSAGPSGFESAPTPEPSPIEATWDALESLPDGARVALSGRIRVGGMTTCRNGICDLVLADPVDDANAVLVDVFATGEHGRPNSMLELASGYTQDDLLLTTADGETVRSGEMVRVVGTLEHHTNFELIDLDLLYRAPEPEPTATPAPKTASFKELARLPAGTHVRVKGRLALPFLLSCDDATCDIHLDDGRSARYAILEMPVAGGDVARRNSMRALPDDFRDRDLRVYTGSGKALRAGAIAWIVGVLTDDPGEPRSIDVLSVGSGS